MTALLARLPGRSKTQAVEQAIDAFLSADAVARLKTLAGALEIEDISGVLRAADRTT